MFQACRTIQGNDQAPLLKSAERPPHREPAQLSRDCGISYGAAPLTGALCLLLLVT
jgi:hypothetical protein